MPSMDESAVRQSGTCSQSSHHGRKGVGRNDSQIGQVQSTHAGLKQDARRSGSDLFHGREVRA